MGSKKNRPILNFGGTQKVVHSSVDGALRGAKVFPKSGVWSKAAQHDGLLIDLSKVTWCEVSACVRLVLLIERALRDGIRVEVALPNPNVLVNEKRWHGEEERHLRAERRRKVLSFLKTIDFRRAISCPHLDIPRSHLTLLERYDRSGLDTDKSKWIRENGVELEEEKHRHKRILDVLPLRWISVADLELGEIQGDLSTIKDGVAKVVGHHTRGILNFDAEAFANVVFHELLSNVKEHAGVDHCLIGIWARRAGQFFLESEYTGAERSFFKDWVEPNSFPLIDVALGDSGAGIQTVLRGAYESEPPPREGVPEALKAKDEGIVFWSLGRWSTSQHQQEKRGTRGLHRVHRLVKGYNGQLTIRAGTVLAGWNHGGHDFREPVATRGLPNCPGTFVSVRLTARRQLTGDLVSPAIQPRGIDFVVGPSIRIEPEGLAPGVEEALRRVLSTGRVSEHRCVIVPLTEAPQNLEDLKIGFEHALEELRDLSNPGALVVLAPTIPPIQLDTYVDSASEVLTRENRSIDARVDSIDVTNPFLVVDRVGRIHWSGMFKTELPVLKRLEELGGEQLTLEELAELLTDAEWRAALWVDLKQHDDLFRALKEGASLRFTVGDVFQFIREAVAARLDDLVDDPLQRGIVQGPLMSPSLCVVGKWLRCAELVDSFGWFEVRSEALEQLRSRRGFPKTTLEALEDRAGRSWHTSRGVVDELGDRLKGRVHDYTQVVLRNLLQVRGPHLPMLALGIAVRDQLSEIEQPEYLVYDAQSIASIAFGLNAWLGIDRRPIPLPTLSRPGELPEVWEVIEDRKVLVYCDIVLTGNSIRQILGRITRSAGRTVAITCLYDQRLPAENGKAIREAGEAVPVIALAAEPGTVVEGPHTGIIDARGGRPTDEPAEGVKLDYPITEAQWLQFSTDKGALFFNHYLVPEQRHAIFHLDPWKLFSSEGCVEATVEAVAAQLIAFEHRHGFRFHPSATLLVHVDDEFPGTLLSELGRRLNIENVNRVRRRDSDHSFEAIRFSTYEKHAIVLLWSASSGTTASRLTYELASMGAKSVQVFVWTSRMRSEREEVLRSIDSLSVETPVSRQAALPGAGFSHPRARRPVPVQIIFLTSVTLPYFSEHRCPVCDIRRRFRGEYRGGYPSTHLRDFAEEMVETFKPKDLTEGACLEPFDCFNSRLTPEECAEMVRLQELVERAVYSTATRLKIRRWLRDVAVSLNPSFRQFEKARLSAKALFRLFSAQLEFFKIPPFNFLEVRKLIADISSAALKLNEYFSEEILRQAIITYRAADKIRFARSLPELVESFVGVTVLLKQLLYDSFTYLSQDYHQNRDHLEPLNEGLEGFIEVIEARISPEAGDYLEVHSIARSVYGLALRRLKQLDRGESTPAQAWRELRRFYGQQFRDAHQQLPVACYALFPGRIIEEASEGLRQPIADRGYWGLTRDKWEQAQVIFERELFPLVRALLNGEGSGLLGSIQAQMFFDAGHLEFLIDVSSEKTSAAITDIGNILSAFSSEPPRTTDDAWRRFRALRENFKQVLLDLPTAESKGALLHQFLTDCPCRLEASIKKILSNAVWKNEGVIRALPIAYEGEIFCHEVVVDQLIEEAVSNALINHRISGADAVVELEVTESDAFIQLAIRNQGSDPQIRNKAASEGRGLSRIHRLLEPYGCKLKHSVPESSWHYEILAAFQRYD